MSKPEVGYMFGLEHEKILQNSLNDRDPIHQITDDLNDCSMALVSLRIGIISDLSEFQEHAR